jgi:serine/threonine protein kinase
MALEFLEASQKLSSRVKARGALLPATGRAVLRNLVSAVEYLHARAVCHRDVKPENVLLVGDGGDIRLIDFNAAKTDAGIYDCLSPGGDLDNSAPEVLREGGSSFASDIWGVGATIYFALCSRFDRGSCFFQEAEWESMPSSLKRHVAGCLELEPARRPTADRLLEELEGEVHDDVYAPTPPSSECLTPVPCFELFGVGGNAPDLISTPQCRPFFDISDGTTILV